MKREEAENTLNEGFTHSIKDPLWQNVPVTAEIKALMENPDVQKGARIKQNGPAYHIYPGAVHTRLSHSVGVYYLGREILLSLSRKSASLPFTREGMMSFLTACLLHDIGHFPYAHSLKELAIREHEELGAYLILNHHQLYDAVKKTGASPLMTARIIDKSAETDNEETLFYRTLLSGALDPDKLDYLSRDGYFSGVPYGRQDTDYVIQSLVISNGVLALEEEAVSSVEQILFSKYMMYRSLYWHKGVRSATAMIKKAVTRAILSGSITYDDLYYLDDNEFNTLAMSHVKETPSLILVDMVEHNNLLERKAEKEYDENGRIERAAKDIKTREEMERGIYRALKPHYPELEEYLVIIDIPERINFESHIPILKADGTLSDINEGNMVFTGEVSSVFQKRLRKVALYLPDYVETRDAMNALMEAENE